MRCVWLNGGITQLRAARIVEALHQIRIAREGFRCGDIFDPVARPNAVGITKGGKAGFAGNPRAGQDHNGPWH